MTKNIVTTKKNLLKNCPQTFKKYIFEGIELAEKYHEGQTRSNGEPFIIHALNTANNLALMNVETNTILAGLLHNTFTNLPLRQDEIYKETEEKLGKDVVEILKATAEISKATASIDTDYEIITKYILNRNKDLRPVLVKLADTLDNVRTIEYMPQERLNAKLQKIFHVYGPLAEYLNLDLIKKEIEEKAFNIYRPQDYEKIESELLEKGFTEENKGKYLQYFTNLFSEFNSDPRIYGRLKSKYSIYNKLKKYLKENKVSLELAQIRDLLAFRVIVSTEEECFKALEMIMDHGDIITEEFDDYITHPKPNGYRALQGPIILKDVSPNIIEIQIMTYEMYYQNTYGTASHVAYKESKSRFAKPTDKYNWIEDIHREMNNNISHREEFVSIPINANIFEDNIYAFTPKGKIIQLDKGDTVVDFAFRVHSAIGYSMVNAKVNNKPVKLDYQIETGNTVEIKTQLGKNSVKPEWIKYAHSPSTQTKIQKSWKNF